MLNKSKTLRILSLTIAVIAFVMISGSPAETSAQSRDPFLKRGGKSGTTTTTSNPSSSSPSGNQPAPKPVKVGPAPVAPPSVEERIAYYYRLREVAAMNGEELPKVTTVMTLGEMSVTGIFKTPRGYAAMVEATPIKLSYTIYPGEKFFVVPLPLKLPDPKA